MLTQSKSELDSLVEEFNNEYLMFPSFLEAIEEVRANLSLFRSTGVVRNLVLLGESGAGKTSICKNIADANPRESLPERDVLPVLRVAIPSVGTISSVCEEMLKKLGDPSPATGTVSAKTLRVIRLIRALAVEMVLIDEGQHIQDRGT